MTTEPFRSNAIFASEKDLRTAFIRQMPNAWSAHVDRGFDVLLVRKSDGVQVGVEVRLGLSPELVEKLNTPRVNADEGPDFVAVLIPWGTTAGLLSLFDQQGVTVIEMRDREMYAYERNLAFMVKKFKPDLPQENAVYWGFREEWHNLAPVQRLAVPERVS
jgi:hypothetical protein